MKNILLLSVLVIFSCSGGDDSSDNNTNSIDGRWNIVSITENGVQIELNSCTAQTYMMLNNVQGSVYVYGNPTDIQGECQEIQVRQLSYSTTDVPNIFIFSCPNNTNACDITVNLEGNDLIWEQTSDLGNETLIWVKD